MLGTVIRRAAAGRHRLLDEADLAHARSTGSTYSRLNALHIQIQRSDPSIPSRYLWGSLHGAHLAKALEVDRISLVEFGVAGGNGLVALEKIAGHLEERLEVGVSVYGFDTGTGLPRPVDVRDCPNLFLEGGFPMDVEALRRRLETAALMLGTVEETLPAFIEGRPDPVAFISFDLDLYSSTKEALPVLAAQQDILLPRVHCFLDDIMGYTYGDHNGERLAVAEFNAEHEQRKVSLIYGLSHFVPRRCRNEEWVEKLYMAHILDHELYGLHDGLAGGQRRDLQ
jgi:hypothetical protein